MFGFNIKGILIDCPDHEFNIKYNKDDYKVKVYSIVKDDTFDYYTYVIMKNDRLIFLSKEIFGTFVEVDNKAMTVVNWIIHNIKDSSK